MEVSRVGDSPEERSFDPMVDQSVVESDYSDDEDCEEYTGQRRTPVNRAFMKGCYIP